MNPDRRPGFPVELRLDGRRVVLRGEGIHLRRDALAAAGAIVDVDGPVEGAWLVMQTRGFADDSQASAFRAECRAAGTLVWIEDAPDLSDITLTAVLESGPVRLSISTGGRSSALTRAVRDALRPLLGEAFVRWAEDAVRRRVRRPRGRFTGGFEPEPPEPPEPDDP